MNVLEFPVKKRISMMSNLSKKDKDKLVRLEHCLAAREKDEYLFQNSDLYADDRAFLETFSKIEISQFKLFQKYLIEQFEKQDPIETTRKR